VSADLAEALSLAGVTAAFFDCFVPMLFFGSGVAA
jgi:hypothetical protein